MQGANKSLLKQITDLDEMVEAIRGYAERRNDRSWDAVMEAYDDDQILEIIEELECDNAYEALVGFSRDVDLYQEDQSDSEEDVIW